MWTIMYACRVLPSGREQFADIPEYIQWWKPDVIGNPLLPPVDFVRKRLGNVVSSTISARRDCHRGSACFLAVFAVYVLCKRRAWPAMPQSRLCAACSNRWAKSVEICRLTPGVFQLYYWPVLERPDLEPWFSIVDGFCGCHRPAGGCLIALYGVDPDLGAFIGCASRGIPAADWVSPIAAWHCCHVHVRLQQVDGNLIPPLVAARWPSSIWVWRCIVGALMGRS